MAGLQGRVFGGYQLGEQLPGAGIAETYRARPSKPGGREAVVKVIYPEFARLPGFIPHFRQIVQMSGRLANHPHVLPLVASGEENGYLYLITPYVAGGTLKDWIARGGRMGPADVAPFFHQLCDALGHAHSLGVAHGNVKPSNIFLFEGRHVLLGDFGLLWDVSHMDMNHAGSGIEVVEYLAPEVAQGQITQQSDIYSVGAVLFASLLGQAPFRGRRPADLFAAHAQQPVPHLAQVNAELPAAILALDTVIQRAMVKRPEQRFPSAVAVAQAIETSLHQAPALLPPQMPGQQGSLGALMPLGAGQSPIANGFLGGPAMPPLGQGAGIAGGLNNGPRGGQPPSIQPMGPGFPPLPPNATVDESMEHGRISVRSPDGVQDGSGIAALPTAYMAAPPPSLAPPSLAYEATMRVPAPGAPPLASGGGAGNSLAFSARPGLGRRLGQAQDPEDFAGQALPAVRPPDSPSAAPGSNPDAAYPGQNSGGRDYSRYAQEAERGWAGRHGTNGRWEEGYAGGEPGGPGDGSRELERWSASAEYSATGSGSQAMRAISPTELGLPRLTSPAMGSMPPGWQEILSSSMPAVSAPSLGRGNARRVRPEEAAVSQGEWADESGRWSAPDSSAMDWEAAEASSTESEAWLPAVGGARRQRWNRPAPEDDPSLEYEVVGRRGRRNRRLSHRRGRRVRVVVVLLMLLSLFDLGLAVIVRPGLCPIAACQHISTSLHQALPFLPGGASEPAPGLGARPEKVRLSVAVSKTAAAALTITNLTANNITWQARSNLPWLTVNPTSGALAGGDSLILTITAKSAGIAPKTYSGTVTVLYGEQRLLIPVSVVVTPAS